MTYRCAHCFTPLEMVEVEVTRCVDHPDGGVEWSVDGEEWNVLQDGE